LYYIYDGLRENKKLERYHLNPDRQYRYLRVGNDGKSNSPKFNVSRNLSKFKRILKILEDFQLGEEEMDTIFCIVAAVLTVGEIRFRESESEGAVVENSDHIERVGELLKIDPSKFGWALTNYCLVRKGAAVRRRSTVDEARDARDVFANNLYARLVDYIVGVINHKLSLGRAVL
jgi:myosin heavy subunit